MTTMHVKEPVCDALFASPLQPSDPLTAETVAAAITGTIRRLTPSGCAGRVAEEFGDHPEQAAERMRWIRQLTSDLSGCLYIPTAVPAATAPAGTDFLPVREAA